MLAACRTAKVTGAGFHIAQRVGHGRRDRQRQPPLLPVERRRPQRHGAQRGRHGSGYYAGDHFDLARLDATQHRRTGGATRRCGRAQPKPIEPGVYPVILEPQAVADLIGFLTNSFDARTADEGRSAFSAKDGKTRVGEALFSERLNLYSDPMHPELPAVPSTGEGIPASRLSLIKAGVLENLRVLALLGAGAKARADARAGQLHHGEHAAAGVDRRHDQGHGARAW